MSSSSFTHEFKYHVFISFRGDDTRAAAISGWHSNVYRREYELIDIIVKHVLEKIPSLLRERDEYTKQVKKLECPNCSKLLEDDGSKSRDLDDPQSLKEKQESCGLKGFSCLENCRINGHNDNVAAVMNGKAKDKVVLYFTSLRGVRKTYKDCCDVMLILEGLGVKVDKRDVSIDSGFKKELKELSGRYFVHSEFLLYNQGLVCSIMSENSKAIEE
ncbi:hypothetical protein RIF29_21271 [Crotalaria pallida]|uniref:Glutaredoxin domain-containing protein n=1 Tax=Crotalaria pallida TaxID=3830 RepID=A0AAN9I9C6_CROPI